MAAKITTNLGCAVPPAPRHSVTVHMPSWRDVEYYGTHVREAVASYKNAYPRMKPHEDIANLSQAILGHLGIEYKACYIFATLQSAKEFLDFATDPRRGDQNNQPLQRSEIEIHAFIAKDRFFAVTYPLDNVAILSNFWKLPGVGVSSRFGEENLKHCHQLAKVDLQGNIPFQSGFESQYHKTLRNRIIWYLDRARASDHDYIRPSASDVYLFPTGMAAIYKPQTYLLSKLPGTVILFGMCFLHTIMLFEDFFPNFKFLGMGTDEDMEKLEKFLSDEQKQGRKIQAIWTECPSNPLLSTPNVLKLHALAREYDVILAVDDTIGSFTNIDVLEKVDLLMTSLTKSFNGFADAMAGSVVLNPNSPKYSAIKALFEANYVPELYVADAQVIEENSRDYLSRTNVLNNNAAALVSYLRKCAEDPYSAVEKVFYPTVNSSGDNFRRVMRPETPDFTPGCGCVLSVELEDIQTAAAFYDALNIHKSPHLGAPVTLAFAYTMCSYATQLEWAASYGLLPTQIRISAGIDDIEVILEEFKIAVEAANKIRH